MVPLSPSTAGIGAEATERRVEDVGSDGSVGCLEPELRFEGFLHVQTQSAEFSRPHLSPTIRVSGCLPHVPATS